MFVTGPDVIKAVTHEQVTKEELGGALTHNERSGVAHFAVDDDARVPAAHPRAAGVPAVATTSTIRRGVERRSAGPRRRGARHAGAGAAEAALRHARRHPRRRRRRLLPRGAPALRAEHAGRASRASAAAPVGIVANQPAHLAGVLDIDASVKGARFVRFCDAFNIPLVTFEDVPGLPARHRCRSTAASSGTARSCCTRLPRRRCRRSR